jgi:hypothetical protein
MLNKLKKKQHYKRIGEDPRRTQGVGGQNRVLSPPFIIPVVLTTENWAAAHGPPLTEGLQRLSEFNLL